MNDCIVSLGAGQWQVDFLERAVGIDSVAVDGHAEAPGFKLAHNRIMCDISEPQSVIEQIEFQQLRPTGAVAHANDAGLISAGAIRDRFCLPGTPLGTAREIRDKARQYKSLIRGGIPVPELRGWSSVQQVVHGPADVGFPLIVKPRVGSGSRGVRRVETQTELEHFLREFSSGEIVSNWLVQDAIDGTEFTVELFVTQSEVIVFDVYRKEKLEGTEGLVSRYLTSIPQENTLREPIIDLAIRAIRNFPQFEGPCHVELIKDSLGGIFVIEINGRGGGFGVQSLLVPATTGASMTQLELEHALGKLINKPVIHHRPGLLGFIPGNPSKASKLTVSNALNELVEYRWGLVESSPPPNQIVKTDAHRIAWVLLTGKPEQELQNEFDIIYERALKELH